jgi:2-polyprenyl-6-methoxyphenol hydroxylase-like FAD-dependent oxidoreductase
VAGSGLGGLALAQGLLRAGADVTVYERDASLAGRRQGYRLHLDARAGLALDATLPPESFARFQATCSQPSTRLAAGFTDGFTAVVGGRIGMAIGVVRFRTPPQALGLTPARDYLMWALAGDRQCFGVPDTELTALDPAGLHTLSAELIRTWHPDLRALHAAADVDETFAIRVRTSPAVPAWPPSRVTVLGDAIHAMSPARGSGANTALQDAALLCRLLTMDGSDVVAAIGDYERQMREYGYAAVAASRQAEAQTGARRNRLLFWLYRRLVRS